MPLPSISQVIHIRLSSHLYLLINYSSPILIFRSILPHSAIFFIFPHLFRLFLPLQLSHTSNLNYLSICPPFSTPTLITPLSDFTTLPSPPPLPRLYHLFILSCPIPLAHLPLFPPSSHLLPYSFPFSPFMTLPDFKPFCPSQLTLLQLPPLQSLLPGEWQMVIYRLPR